MNGNETPGPSPFDDFLRRLLGDEATEEANHAMRVQGFDSSQPPEGFSDPATIKATANQFQFFMDSTTGPVSWGLVTDSAHQQIYAKGDSVPSTVQAGRVYTTMTVADLWFDTTGDFTSGSVERKVWTRSEWVDATLDTWKRICEPVTANVSRALGEALGSQFPSEAIDEEDLPPEFAQMIDQTRSMMPKLSAMMLAAQIGRALTASASEALGSTDVGIPLTEGPTTGLVVSNAEAFGDGLDIPFDEILQFVTVHEYAHRRLFAPVPWLEGDLIRAVERYSTNIEVDMATITDVASLAGLSDPSSIDQALSGDVFELSISTEQKRALERLETILALIEEWVEVVTAQTIAPHLPHADQLREMMRRHHASGGPAGQVLGTLIGLKMRPRRARSAAKILTLIKAGQGAETRDALWSHPDMVSSTVELDSPDTFLTIRRAALEQDADIDAALDASLAGTMGWAGGLTSEMDPEAETLAKAGLTSLEDPYAQPTEDEAQQGGIEDDAGSAQSDDTPQKH